MPLFRQIWRAFYELGSMIYGRGYQGKEDGLNEDATHGDYLTTTLPAPTRPHPC